MRADPGFSAAERDGSTLPNALSVDLEEWYHAELVRRAKGRGSSCSGKSHRRVAYATPPILDLLEKYHVRATFFIVGEIVRDEPDLVRRIHDRGHEIGCHGMTHRPLWELTPSELEREVVEFRRVGQDALGPAVEIRGFRAPTFSLDRSTAWALPLLAEHGYTYDASVFPMRSPLYGIPGAPLDIYPVDVRDPGRKAPASSLYEVPVTLFAAGRVRLPVGGVYLRLLPRWLLISLLRRVRRSRPLVLNIHPWETDPGTPHSGLPLTTSLAMSTGVDSALDKLEALLQAFPFGTMGELVSAWRRANAWGPDQKPRNE